MDFATIFVISLAVIIAVCLVAVLLGPLFGWRMAARNVQFIPFSSRVEAQDKIRNAFLSLGWEIERDDPDEMIARTNPSWRSWGEIVKVELEDEGAMVSSECSLPMQVIDYGKNKINIQMLMDTVMKKSA